MRKKLILSIIFIILLITLTGCSLTTSINLFDKGEKPLNNYYTNLLKNDIELKEPKKVSMFYREFFKEFTFPTSEVTDILSFIKALNNEDYFIDKPSDLPDTYKYKVYLEFDNKKYAMTVFNEKYISIYTWDGDYTVDYINISEVPLSLNVYGICKYFAEE